MVRLYSKILLCFFITFLCSNIARSSTDTFTHKFNLSIGGDYQIFAGDFRENTRNRFYSVNNIVVNGLSTVMANGNADKKGVFSFIIAGNYDFQININSILNPFVGVGLDLSFPITKINNIYSYKTNIGNFADVKVRIGNSFKVFGIFDINVYADGGFGTSIWYANGDTISAAVYTATRDVTVEKQYLESDIKISYGYVFGGGVDFVIKEFYSIGIFYNFHRMFGGQSGLDTAVSYQNVANICHETFVDKYTNHTVGMRFGIQMKI